MEISDDRTGDAGDTTTTTNTAPASNSSGMKEQPARVEEPPGAGAGGESIRMEMDRTQPRTPSFDSGIASTPAWSSPDTPRDGARAAEKGRRGQEMGRGKVDVHVDVEEGMDANEGMDVEDEGVEEGDMSGMTVVPDEVVRDRQRRSRDDIQSRRDMQGAEDGGSSRALIGRDDGQSDEEEEDMLDASGLKRLRDRLDAIAGEAGDPKAGRDEAVAIARRLLTPALEQLPFVHDQVQTQKETIKTLQEQAKLSKQLMRIERDRHTAERAGWRAEMQALERVKERDIASGKRPSKVLDLDVGYHLELEAANKRLEMDNRLMAPRLADTQRQIDKLVTELRHLRSHVILPTAALSAEDASHAGPSMAPPTLPKRSPAKAMGAYATMGDARTEHLLLASRRLRTMRVKDDTIGRLTLEELHRGGVVGPSGGVGYAEGYGEALAGDEEDEYADISDEDEIKPFDRRGSISHSKGRTGATPLLPRAKRSNKRSLPPPTTPRSKAAAQRQPLTTPGGGNFNDLLRAAEMATRPSTPTPPASAGMMQMPMSAMSATRSTTRGREAGGSGSERGSPVKRPRRDGPWSGGGDVFDEEDESSALDLLAQASQLDVAQSQDDEGAGASQGSGGLGPAIDLRSTPTQGNQQQQQQQQQYPQQQQQYQYEPQQPQHPQELHQQQHPAIDPALTADQNRRSSGPLPISTPQTRPRALSNTSIPELHTPARKYDAYEDTPQTIRSPPSSLPRDMHEPPPGAYASPTGATVPGLGKYVHLTNNMPARRIRSPYLKWTNEEDELLARAVAEHGEKWDMVSKGVPTRSYHQVRQRWLRKTGAFDKKPQIEVQVNIGERGNLGAGGGGGGGIGNGNGVEDDDDGSPTPTPGGGVKTPGGKKRKASQGLVR